MKCCLDISNFLEEIPSLSHSIVLLHFFTMLKKGFLSLFDVLWNPGFSWVYHSLFLLPFTYLLSSAICKASSDNHFPLYLFFFETVLVTASCTMLQTSIHSSSGNLLYLIPWMSPLPPLYYNKGFFFFRSYLNGPVVFPTFFPPIFFNLSLNFTIRSSLSESQAIPGLIFTGCIVLLLLWLQRT